MGDAVHRYMEAMPLAAPVMHLQPSPTWYLYDAGGPEEVRLLDDDGRAEPALSGAARVLAELAEALHANACHLGERELRHLELFVALQRWRR